MIRSLGSRSSSSLLSTSSEFERYIEQARGVLRIGDERIMETNSARVALALMAMEKEKDKELSVLLHAEDTSRLFNIPLEFRRAG